MLVLHNRTSIDSYLTKLFHNWVLECQTISWRVSDNIIDEAYKQPAAYQIPNGINNFIDL
jgi:hypothetical protein